MKYRQGKKRSLLLWGVVIKSITPNLWHQCRRKFRRDELSHDPDPSVISQINFRPQSDKTL